MKQDIYKDDFGVDFWDQDNFARVFIHIINSEMYEQITGEKAPDPVIDAHTYSMYGYPWYDVYNESPNSSLPQSDTLNNIKTVSEIDNEKYHGVPQQDDSSVTLTADQVKLIKLN